MCNENKELATLGGHVAQEDPFIRAYDIVISGHEGGFANDPDDPGGMTYAGVARRFHPNWIGWSTIDNVVASAGVDNQNEIDSRLKKHPQLAKLVRSFYRTNYWDSVSGDSVALYSRRLAHELFDTAVNQGIAYASQHLQRGLNCLNSNKSLYNDLRVDGNIGPKTLNALRLCHKYQRTGYLITIINVLQGERYISLMEQNHTFEKYVGWFKRVNLIPDKFY